MATMYKSSSGGRRGGSNCLRRINHAVLWVTELERSIQFYETILGLTVIAREPAANAAFLREKVRPIITILDCSVGL